jgi:hypothetical protein
MNKPFRTIVDVKPYPFGLDYSTPALFLGSCFTENIGQVMLSRKFPVMVNPFGIVYNPISVGQVLGRITEGKLFVQDDLIQHNNLWLSLDHHTAFSNADKADCLNAINSSLSKSVEFWKSTQYLIVTFGTARVYHYNKTGLPVANCHKIPAKEFTHKLLSVDEIVALWSKLLNGMLREKPKLKVIFTVSPVRHWKDGPIGNQVSKSTLILAVHQLQGLFPEMVFYFPSYEIMMDDLRDYRYFNDDMLHPSPLAIGYIWDKFKLSLINASTQQTINEIEKIIQAIGHRPFNTKTNEFRQFIENTQSKIHDLLKRYPNLDFTSEINELQKNLSN